VRKTRRASKENARRDTKVRVFGGSRVGVKNTPTVLTEGK